ncbi:MAG TPA: VTT domain-containing protein, partial [Gammaproteobacteria bacterium]
PFVNAVLGPRGRARLDGWTEGQGAVTLLVARFIPVIAFNLINYAAGLTSVSWWTFAWTTAIGILPLTLLMVLLGEQMTAVPWWAWAVLLAVALASGWLLHRVRTLRRRSALVPLD